MLLAAIAAISLFQSGHDYFPLTPGTKWTYEDEGGVQAVDEAMAPVDVNVGESTPIKASPIVTTIGAKKSTPLYRTSDTAVFLLGSGGRGSKPPDLLPSPQTILDTSKDSLKWEYVGQ